MLRRTLEELNLSPVLICLAAEATIRVAKQRPDQTSLRVDPSGSAPDYIDLHAATRLSDKHISRANTIFMIRAEAQRHGELVSCPV